MSFLNGAQRGAGVQTYCDPRYQNVRRVPGEGWVGPLETKDSSGAMGIVENNKKNRGGATVPFVPYARYGGIRLRLSVNLPRRRYFMQANHLHPLHE